MKLPQFFRPKPKAISPTPFRPAQIAMTDVAAKADMIADIRKLPESGYAVLVTMTPDEDGILIESNQYPANPDTVAYHGMYNYAAEYLHLRCKGQME